MSLIINSLIKLPSGDTPPPVPTTFPIDDIVVFGASIMAQSFAGANEQVTKDLYAAKGATVNVHERATPGDTTDRMLSKLPALITEFSANAERTLFVIHGGGNDVSQGSGYPDNASAIDTNFRSMLQSLKDNGFKIALSDISYRIPPASNPTAPYNTNVMASLINDFADITFSMYNLTFNNQDTWFEGDGIHPNSVGEDLTRKLVVDSTYERFSNLGPIPEPTAWEDVLLSFGQGDVNPDGNNKLFSSSKLLSSVVNIDQSVIPNAEVELLVVDGHTNQGRGNVNDPSDTSLTLTNNTGLSNYCYTQNKALTLNINSGLDRTATYTVGFTCSRAAADVRNNLVSIGGQEQTINATASPAEALTFTGVSGAALLDNIISVTPVDPTIYAYISMIRITKEP